MKTLKYSHHFNGDFELKLSFDELAGGDRNYTQVGNSEINIEQRAAQLITPQ